MEKLIGRKEEKATLEKLYRSQKAEFLAIYGRRRIGKTFLVYNFFKDLGVYFEITGSKDASNKEQLADFHREFIALFKSEANYAQPKNWSEAFHQLHQALKEITPTQKIILFFDELPWLAIPKSGFLRALEYFWNRHFSRMPNILLIICGSAASWMIKKIINNKGGLHGRLSAEIRLQSFSLIETEEFFTAKGINLTRKQIVEIYMATGGVAEYLSHVELGKSSAQTINSLCFTPQSPLLREFHKLYDSLFNDTQKHVKVVRELANKRHGMTQQELFRATEMPPGGRSVEILNELEESGFIISTQEFGKEVRERKFRLIDEYTLFYLTWIDDIKQSILQGTEKDYWGKIQLSPSWHSWAGYAFENICLKHVIKIKEALEIGGVSSRQWHWQFRASKDSNIDEGAEVDLVLDRADQCINLCEMKFYNNTYVLKKHDVDVIKKKKRLFLENTRLRKAIFVTLITSYGAKETEHYHECIDNQLTLDDLF